MSHLSKLLLRERDAHDVVQQVPELARAENAEGHGAELGDLVLHDLVEDGAGGVELHHGGGHVVGGGGRSQLGLNGGETYDIFRRGRNRGQLSGQHCWRRESGRKGWRKRGREEERKRGKGAREETYGWRRSCENWRVRERGQLEVSVSVQEHQKAWFKQILDEGGGSHT